MNVTTNIPANVNVFLISYSHTIISEYLDSNFKHDISWAKHVGVCVVVLDRDVDHKGTHRYEVEVKSPGTLARSRCISLIEFSVGRSLPIYHRMVAYKHKLLYICAANKFTEFSYLTLTL